jgi:AcrR family transcriptional regulator
MERMQDLKIRISAAAQEIFLAEGVNGVSMRRIADRVGVTPPAIYRHFRDKDELLDEIVSSGLEILDGYLKAALAAPDPYQRLIALADAYLAFALEQPKHFDLAFMIPAPARAMSLELQRHNRETFRFAVEQIGLCMREGHLRPGDPLETAVLLWSTAHGMVTLYKMGRMDGGEDQFRALYRGAIRRLLEAFRL